MVVLVVIIVALGSGGKNYTVTNDTSKTETKKVTKTELLSQNNPNLKKVRFATADYVGQEFTYYVLAEPSDYYNYGFNDESKYYSISIEDDSTSDDYESTYAYINKTDTSKRAGELLDLLLKEPTIIKITVSIPREKYQEGANSFFEIQSWEEVK